MGNFPGGWELILVLLVIVVVFGSKRLPDSARALGRSMRILKAETKGLHDDGTDARTAADTRTTAVQAGVPAPTVDEAPAAPAAQPYRGQQLFDAEGRPVQVPGAAEPRQG